MLQYLPVAVAFGSHYRGPYLAQSHAVAPAGAGYHNALGYAIGNIEAVNHESRTFKVAVA